MPSSRDEGPPEGILIGPSPVPPVDNQKTRIFTGAVMADKKTLSFKVPDSTWIYLDLQLDIDGDGELDRSTRFVYLRQLRVNPPFTPFVIGLPERYRGPLTPDLNFRLGIFLVAGPRQVVLFRTDIETLERH